MSWCKFYTGLQQWKWHLAKWKRWHKTTCKIAILGLTVLLWILMELHTLKASWSSLSGYNTPKVHQIQTILCRTRACPNNRNNTIRKKTFTCQVSQSYNPCCAILRRKRKPFLLNCPTLISDKSISFTWKKNTPSWVRNDTILISAESISISATTLS